MKRRYKGYIIGVFSYRKIYKGLSCQWDPSCFTWLQLIWVRRKKIPRQGNKLATKLFKDKIIYLISHCVPYHGRFQCTFDAFGTEYEMEDSSSMSLAILTLYQSLNLVYCFTYEVVSINPPLVHQILSEKFIILRKSLQGKRIGHGLIFGSL